MHGLRGGMDYCKLGTSDLLVSKVCMGTHDIRKTKHARGRGVEQLNVAFHEYGVNFIRHRPRYIPRPRAWIR